MKKPNESTENDARLLWVLGNTVRLQIVRILADGEQCVTDLVDVLDVAQPTVTYHLDALQKALVVRRTPRGRRTYVSINTGDGLTVGPRVVSFYGGDVSVMVNR